MANFNLNKVMLGGRLTATPELKQTQSGVMVTAFTIAVNRRGTKEGTAVQADFVNCIAWREKAEFVTKYFGKGSSICVVGQIQTRTYTDKQNVKRYATEVVVDEVHFVDSKGDGGAAIPTDADVPPVYGTPSGNLAPSFETIADDDELPF